MNENEGSAVDAVHPERPGGWVRRADGWALLMDSDGEVAGELAPEDVAALRVLLLVPSPPVAPQAAVDVTALPEWDALERWLADETGEVLGAVEGALFSVAMDRGRGEKVSDQAESVRVLHALRRLAAARRAAGEADRG